MQTRNLRNVDGAQETGHKTPPSMGFLIDEVREQAKQICGGRSQMRSSWAPRG